jgi:hypothetical protein
MSAVVDGKPFGTASVEALQPTQVAVVITPSFLRAFTAGQSLVIYGPFRNVIGRFSLKGTSKAVSAVGAFNAYLAQRSTTQDRSATPCSRRRPRCDGSRDPRRTHDGEERRTSPFAVVSGGAFVSGELVSRRRGPCAIGTAGSAR